MADGASGQGGSEFLSLEWTGPASRWSVQACLPRFGGQLRSEKLSTWPPSAEHPLVRCEVTRTERVGWSGSEKPQLLLAEAEDVAALRALVALAVANGLRALFFARCEAPEGIPPEWVRVVRWDPPERPTDVVARAGAPLDALVRCRAYPQAVLDTQERIRRLLLALSDAHVSPPPEPEHDPRAPLAVLLHAHAAAVRGGLLFVPWRKAKRMLEVDRKTLSSHGAALPPALEAAFVVASWWARDPLPVVDPAALTARLALERVLLRELLDEAAVSASPGVGDPRISLSALRRSAMSAALDRWGSVARAAEWLDVDPRCFTRQPPRRPALVPG